MAPVRGSPLSEQAYEEPLAIRLLFQRPPRRVIDHLPRLALEPASPVAVKLTAVKGDLPSTRPWCVT